MPVLQLDTFTGAANSRLDQHLGEQNCIWQRLYTNNYPNLLRISNARRVYYTWENPELGNGTKNGGEHFTSLYSPSSASYVVEANFWNLGAFLPVLNPGPYPPPGTPTYTTYDSVASIMGRCSQIDKNYMVQYRQSDSTISLIRNNGPGVTTNLASYFYAIPTGNKVKIQLVLRGYYIEVWQDDVMQIRYRDVSVSSWNNIGYAGIRIDGGTDEFLGVHLDDFKVHTDFPPFIMPNDLDLYGSGNSSGVVNLNWTA